MIGAKLKVLEETIYEDAAKRFNECGIAPSIACLVMKSIESRFQEMALSELSVKLLQTGAPGKETKTGTVEDLKEDIKNG